MSLVNTYYSATEPTDLSPGTIWLRSDGTKAQRSLSNSWIEKGSWTQDYDGMLPAEGGTVLGPVLGNHGHLEVENPSATGTMTIDGEEVPTKPWVTAQIENFRDSIQAFITEIVSGGEGNITIGNNLAIGYGSIAHGGTIPLPKYADDTRATIAQLWVTPFVGPRSQMWGQGEHDTTLALECWADPSSLIVTCRTRVIAGGGSYQRAYDGTANYLIICKR